MKPRALSAAALACAAFVVPLAAAQPPSAAPKKPFPQRDVPPSKPAPPGTLEGRSLPPALRGAPQAAPAQAIVSMDRFLARNASASPVWVTIDQPGIAKTGACLHPKEEKALFYAAGVPTTLRAESTDRSCEERAGGCDAAFQLRPGVQGVELRDAGRGACQWQPLGGGMLRWGTSNLTIANPTGYWMWLTVYAKAGDPVFGFPVVDKAIETRCVPPGQTTGFSVTKCDTHSHSGQCMQYSGIYRAELTSGRNCAHPLICDTRITDASWRSTNQTLSVYYDPSTAPPFMMGPCFWY